MTQPQMPGWSGYLIPILCGQSVIPSSSTVKESRVNRVNPEDCLTRDLSVRMDKLGMLFGQPECPNQQAPRALV